MDTDALRLFILAAEKLNISAAGKSLGLAPAVSSARLAKLENSLGIELLHRTTRKVALSLEGANFLPFAREIIAQEDAARAALGIGKVDIKGTLRFAASSSFAQLYIAPVLPKFLIQWPDVSLDLRFSDTEQDLLEGSFDLALRNTKPKDSSLKGRKLADDHRILCAAPSYLDERGRPESIEDLAEHDLIVFKSWETRPLRDRSGAEAGQFPPPDARRRILIDDGTSQKVVTLAGAGISANALWSISSELKSGQLEQVLPNHRIDDGVVLWLVFPKSNVLSPKVRIFMDFLIAEIGRAPPWESK